MSILLLKCFVLFSLMIISSIGLYLENSSASAVIARNCALDNPGQPHLPTQSHASLAWNANLGR
ncbi:hypothetical protein OE88DRAFT_1667598 [Heliocybe sulcata]|uniref:Uncharacterized protein n=1 Tax=Heliocybe sulcata TaxID=5364 RepID=A0A5C3MS25_9AGAM|nr:hypothetical protein OE88DRAFT_1667598 [Heliocybe sulcata]